MATVKLTLSADEDTVLLAKSIASEDNISVSKLFKTLINELAKKRNKKDPLLEKYKDVKVSDEILSLTGILKGKYPEDMNYKDMKYEYLKDKYGL
jgi:ABC-type phosphate transport system auxiliary subunit